MLRAAKPRIVDLRVRDADRRAHVGVVRRFRAALAPDRLEVGRAAGRRALADVFNRLDERDGEVVRRERAVL